MWLILICTHASTHLSRGFCACLYLVYAFRSVAIKGALWDSHCLRMVYKLLRTTQLHSGLVSNNTSKPFPLSQALLCYFVFLLASQGLSIGTIKVYLAATTKSHWDSMILTIPPCPNWNLWHTDLMEAINTCSVCAVGRTLLKIELNKDVQVWDSQSTCVWSKTLEFPAEPEWGGGPLH